MNVNLKCKKRKLDGSYKDFSEWDIPSIDSKILNQEYSEILSEAHNYRETRTTWPETILYICSCNTDINIEMKIVLNNNIYRFSDFDAGQHNRECPFFSFKQHRNEEGRVIALSSSMFQLPKDTPNVENTNIAEGNEDTAIARISTKRVNAFNGLMYSFFDSINISLNRNKNYSKVLLARQFIGRFLNTQVGVENNETFLEYRDRVKDNQSINLTVGVIEDLTLSLRKIKWDNNSGEYVQETNEHDEYINHVIDAEFIENIKSKKFKFMNKILIYSNKKMDTRISPIIKNKLVMKQTLQGIRNYNNFTKGSYFVVKIDSVPKSEKYGDTVQFFLQPMFISKKFILPVESHFERKCIQYLEEQHNNICLYKPMTLDKALFFQNFQNFLAAYPEYFNIYKQACDAYDRTKVIRPDLFMLKEDKLYVFEFAGYREEQYLLRLQKKEEEFYSHFDNIVEIEYRRISIDSKL